MSIILKSFVWPVLLLFSGSAYASNLEIDGGSGSRCAAIDAMRTSNDDAVTKNLVLAISGPDPVVRACAIRAAGESGNETAIAPLLAHIEIYLKAVRVKGAYEDNITMRLSAIDSIWALGEIGDPALMEKFSRFYDESDDVLRMNLIISMGKLRGRGNAVPYIEAIAVSAGESEVVRSVAFEMLEELGRPLQAASLAASKNVGIEKADLIYTGGTLGTMGSWGTSNLPVGHTGIFVETEVKNGRISVVILDCVPNDSKPYGGVRNIYSWKDFTNQFRYPYYGNRTTSPTPTPFQRSKIVEMGLSLGKRAIRYDVTHFSQKGPVKFDCVGYTEYLYEQAGLNPTDDSYESGLGWPLTPWEQFISVKPNVQFRL